MGAPSKLEDVQNQVMQFWSPMFMQELREQTLLAGLVNREYEGEIKKMGDTVRVSQVNKPQGQLLSIDKTGAAHTADSFDTEAVQLVNVDVKADKRAVAAYEMEDLIALQSQIQEERSEIRDSLRSAVEEQINDYLYSLSAPSAAAPDHQRNGVATYDASELLAVRELAAEAKWRKDKPWWLLMSPQYYSDLLNAQTLTSSDFVGGDQPVVAGQIVSQRYGFSILEDNSRTGQTALAFSPDYLLMVMQRGAQFKVSDLHSQKKFGYVLSVDVIFGAKLGINGDIKHIVTSNP